MAEPRISEYTKALEKNPASTAFARLADIFRKSGETNRAIEICQEGLGHNPSYITGHLILGRCYLERGITDKAQESFEQALALDPRNLLALKMLGDILISQGRKKDGVRRYGQILSMDPLDSSIRELYERYNGFELFGDPVQSGSVSAQVESAMAEAGAPHLSETNEPQETMPAEPVSGPELETADVLDQLTSETVAQASSMEEVKPKTENARRGQVNELGEEELIVPDSIPSTHALDEVIDDLGSRKNPVATAMMGDDVEELLLESFSKSSEAQKPAALPAESTQPGATEQEELIPAAHLPETEAQPKAEISVSDAVEAVTESLQNEFGQELFPAEAATETGSVEAQSEAPAPHETGESTSSILAETAAEGVSEEESKPSDAAMPKPESNAPQTEAVQSGIPEWAQPEPQQSELTPEPAQENPAQQMSDAAETMAEGAAGELSGSSQANAQVFPHIEAADPISEQADVALGTEPIISDNGAQEPATDVAESQPAPQADITERIGASGQENETAGLSEPALRQEMESDEPDRAGDTEEISFDQPTEPGILDLHESAEVSPSAESDSPDQQLESDPVDAVSANETDLIAEDKPIEDETGKDTEPVSEFYNVSGGSAEAEEIDSSELEGMANVEIDESLAEEEKAPEETEKGEIPMQTTGQPETDDSDAETPLTQNTHEQAAETEISADDLNRGDAADLISEQPETAAPETERDEDPVSEFYNVAGGSAESDSVDSNDLEGMDRVTLDEPLESETEDEPGTEASEPAPQNEPSAGESTQPPEEIRPERSRIDLPEGVASPTLAELFLHQGQRDQAIEVYRYLLGRDPSNYRLASRLREIEMGTAQADIDPEPAKPKRSQPRKEGNRRRRRPKNDSGISAALDDL